MTIANQAAPAPTKDQSASEGWVGASTLARVSFGLLLAVASGVVALLAFPPFELWPLIFVAFIPMVYAQHRVLPLAWSSLAPGVTMGIYFASQLSAGLSGVVWYIQLWPVYVCLLVAALGYPARRFHAHTHYRWLAFVFPIVWVGLDAAREFSGMETLGGTWANPAYALYEQAWLLQPLAIFGIFGLQLFILVTNCAIAAVCVAWLDRRRSPVSLPAIALRPAVRLLAGLAVAWSLWIVLSFSLMDQPPTQLRVGTVQSNAMIDPEEDLQRVMQATRDLAADGAQVVVWREGGLKFDPLRERTDELRALAAETGAHIAIGYGVKEPDGTRRNEAVLLTPQGHFFGPYGKAHPGRFAGDHSDTFGEYKVYDTVLGKIATIICYDLDFTDSAREMARRGAQFIAVPSNDVPAIAETHYTHLVFRAIENRLPMAKSDAIFDTAIIDSHGRILARNVNAFSQEEVVAVTTARSLPAQTLIADVALGTGDTFLVRTGEWVGWLAIAMLLALLGLQLRSWVRPGRTL